jgi:hypothetical protein
MYSRSRRCRGRISAAPCRWRFRPRRAGQQPDRPGRVGRPVRCIREVRNADADQPEPIVAQLAFQQVQPGAEDPVGQHGRVLELEIARPALEICSLELEHHRLSGHARGLEPRRDLFRQPPQNRHEILRLGQVAVESGFRRNAFRPLIGVNRAVILAARQMDRAVCPSRRSGASARGSSMVCNCPMVRMPSRSSVAAKALPTPQIR